MMVDRGPEETKFLKCDCLWKCFANETRLADGEY